MRSNRASSILLSSAGRRGELVQILRTSLADLGLSGRVVATDASPYTAAGALSDELVLVPLATSPDFIDAVLQICETREIAHIIPTIDPELPIYAAARERFAERGVRVWVSSPEAVRIASDKRLTQGWLAANGLPGVDQWNLEEVARGDVTFPLIAKPAMGSSSMGIVIVNDVADLQYLDAGLDYVVERIAPGVEYTVDVLVDLEGTCVATVPRKRLETRGGEVSKACTEAQESLMTVARQIAERLPGAVGVLNVQMFYCHESATISVIEINARFGGGFPLAFAAGCRMPAWFIEHTSGVTHPTSSLSWHDQFVMLRFDQGVYAQGPL